MEPPKCRILVHAEGSGSDTNPWLPMRNPPRLAKGETHMKSNAMRKESESETAGRTTRLRVLPSEVGSGAEAAEFRSSSHLSGICWPTLA